MTTILRRVALVSVASLALAAFLPAPGGAQTTTETTISYAADSSSTGFLLAITPPDSDPAFAVTAAATEGSITSDGPAASGSAEVAALADESAGRAATDAPPDETAQEQSSIPAAASIPLGPLGTVGVGAIQGEAESASEAEDGLPSTENDASFSGAEIDLGLTLPEPFGAVGGNVTVLGGSTASDAAAAGERDVSASAVATGLEVSANLDIELLAQVCAQLPPGPLQDACESLVGPDQNQPAAIDVTLGSSDVECSWNGDAADCTGDAAAATIRVLGQEPVEVAPGETVTIPPDPGPNDPFLVRVALGTVDTGGGGTDSAGGGSGVSETTSTYEASAVATGLSVELLGPAASGPGVVTLEIGESTAGISAKVATREIIARTGGTVLPLLLGGAMLVVLGVGLRRYLKRA